MQDLNIIKIIKKIFLNKSFIYVFFVSFISLIIILAVGLGFVWRYRANVFDYFAKEYLQELQNPNNSLGSGGKLTAEKIAEKQSIFSQESFVIDAVKKTNPAVISIVISKNVPKYETYVDPNQQQNPFGDLFPNFFFNIPQYRQNGTEKKDIPTGMLLTKKMLNIRFLPMMAKNIQQKL